MSSSRQPSAPASAAASASPTSSEGTERAAGRAGTFSSLANPPFRLLWVSMLFSFTAIQMMFIAQGYLTYDLTGTATSLGLVSLGWGIPQLAFSLIGGVAADRLHKRWLIVLSQATMAATSFITAVLIQTGVIAVWQIFVMALISGTVFAFNVPARQAWIPELVGEERLMNAIALNSAAFTATGIVGPGLAGGLIAVPFIGLTGVYYLMAGCFVVVVLMVARIPGGEPAAEAQGGAPLEDLLDGLRYVRRHAVLPTIILMGFVPIVIGMPYRTFFPVFSEDIYGVGPVGLGAMGVVMSVGALVGSLYIASLPDSSRRSLIQLALGLGFGMTLILFAAAPVLALGLLVLLFLGFAANAFWALNNTMVLGNTAKQYYGRVMSVYMLSWSVMPFAAVPESALADVVGVQMMVAGTGALVIILLLAVVLLMPGFGRLQEQETSAVQAVPTP